MNCRWLSWLWLLLVVPVVRGRNDKLLLILVDGVRWDYPDREAQPGSGFRTLAENGVRAPHMTPIFPANSYPNWYSLVTGLYAESHGFVQNMMFDSEHDDFFLMEPNETASVRHWWEHAEPLWITAQKNGARSALYWWGGCAVEIRGRKPTFCRPYRNAGSSWPTLNQDTQEAFDTALELLANGEIRLVQVYYEPVDFYGHRYGPDSSQRKQAFKDIDGLLEHLQREMDHRGLHDSVNLVVVSDHGMTATDGRDLNIIDLHEHLDVSDIRYMVYSGASSMLLPYEGKLQKVYDALQGVEGLRVYKKEDIPERYHLKNSHLTLPLLLVAAKNYYIRGLDIPGKSIPTGSAISAGSHGYDPEEVTDMRGIFFARGPKLRRNYTSAPLKQVDIYNILCHLLDIEPLPNNGTRSLAADIVGDMPYSSASRVCACACLLWIWLLFWRFVET